MKNKEIELSTLAFDVLHEIENYALLTAGTINNFNMMTATGFMYGKFFLQPMLQVYVRPNRYTYKFFEENHYFTVSFYDPKYHESLITCGEIHGDKCNKVELVNFHPFECDNTVVFEEAKITFVCEKIYHTDVQQNNFDSQEVHKEYYLNQSLLSQTNMELEKKVMYHRIYLGRIKKVLVNADYRAEFIGR